LYVARLSMVAVPLTRLRIPGFSPKLVKTIIYMVPELGLFRKLYEARLRFKPFSITPLFEDGGRALIGSRSVVVEPGTRLRFCISIAFSDPATIEELGFDQRVVEPRAGEKLLVSLDSVEVVSVDMLSIGLERSRIVRLRFLSPVLLSTKLMAPPLPHFLKRVAKIRERYVLYPSSAHICSYLTKLWNTVFPEKPVSRKVSDEWAAYYMGRLCEVAMVPIDYRTQPVTVVYDSSRKPRGFVGWALYEIGDVGRKTLSRIDKILALANYLGLGKSRSIGFGTVRAETVERRG